MRSITDRTVESALLIGVSIADLIAFQVDDVALLTAFHAELTADRAESTAELTADFAALIGVEIAALIASHAAAVVLLTVFHAVQMVLFL